ncbi:hypothetical protein [Streptomyces lydicus]|uniref:hypothetical protein n=1 Tax=Streptomyces lydicus TaxID=47763 RepID=UPI000C4015CE|nr:hypothetical protein [Streptomyces lydicus]
MVRAAQPPHLRKIADTAPEPAAGTPARERRTPAYGLPPQPLLLRRLAKTGQKHEG